MLQRQFVELVDGHDVIQMLQVPLLVSHEVRDSGPRKDGQVAQLLHVLVRHLEGQRSKGAAASVSFQLSLTACTSVSVTVSVTPTFPKVVNVLKSMFLRWRSSRRIPSR